MTNYQRSIREFWVDTETTGSYEDEQGESFQEETGAEGQASSFILGGVGPDEPLSLLVLLMMKMKMKMKMVVKKTRPGGLARLGARSWSKSVL